MKRPVLRNMMSISAAVAIVIAMLWTATPMAHSADGLPGSPEQRFNLPVLNEQSTIDDYLAFAALNSPRIDAAFNRLQAVKQRPAQARALPDPMLSYEFETDSSPRQHTVGIAQTFPWFGKLSAREEVANQAVHVAETVYRAELIALFNAVRQAYYEYYFLGQSIAILDENIRLAEHLHRVVQVQFEAGLATGADLIRSQVELGRLQDRARALQDVKPARQAQLNALLNRPPAAPLPIPETLDETSLELREPDLQALLEEHNPQLDITRAQAGEWGAGIEVARRASHPDVTLGLEYMRDVAGGMNGDKNAVGAMIMLNLPLNRERYRAIEREARLNYRASLDTATNTQTIITAQLHTALYEHRDAVRRVALYRDSLLPQARQSLDITQRAFEAQTANLLEFIDSLQTLLEFELAYQRGVADRSRAIANIDALTGGKILSINPTDHQRQEVPAEDNGH